MTKREIYLYDGATKASIDSLPPEAWTSITGGSDAADETKYYQSVPWMFRGTHIIADAVASLPFAIVGQNGEDVDNSDDYQNVVKFLPEPESILWMCAAGLTQMGRAYLFQERNLVKTLGLRYLVPTSIDPVYNENGELVGFKRRIRHQIIDLGVEDVAYFWLPDPMVEMGPPEAYPAKAALMAAGVLYNLDEFAAGFFERGAIKATLLKYAGSMPTEQEKKRIKSWWQRVFSGIGNAWASEIVSADTETEVIGEGLAELASKELTTQQREDIAQALGIPMTIMWSTEAGGLGGGGVVQSDERKFYEQTIIPLAKRLAAVLNMQVFGDGGLRLVFRPETLDIFQTDENQRAQALSLYVNAGYRLGLASQILGVELPAGVDYDDLDTMREEDRDAAAERMQEQGGPFGQNQPPGKDDKKKAMTEDLRRWRHISIMKDLRVWQRKAKSRGGDIEFESSHIPAGLNMLLSETIKTHGIDEAFRFLKAASRGTVEKRLAQKLADILANWLQLVTVTVSSNGDVNYDAFAAEVRAVLQPELAMIATEQALSVATLTGVDFDVAVVNEYALDWAQRYGYELVQGITSTTRNVVSRAVSQFVETPGMTQGDLTSLLEPAFGQYRAKMIATTETTRAYSAAATMHQNMLSEVHGMNMQRVWRTREDERVCPICGPLADQPESVWNTEFPDGPPAHVNCRCGIALEYVG